VRRECSINGRNLIIWDIIGRGVKERIPPVQTLKDLEQTLHQEWQGLVQVQIRRLVGSMRRPLAAVIRGPCIQRMIVKVRHNTCFKDVLPIDLSIEVSSYSSPHHD
jgi:hypothetical protein